MTRKWKEIYSFSCLLVVAPLLMMVMIQEFSPHFRVVAAAAAAVADNRQCYGSMAECGDIDEEELVMESESSRRIVQAKRISYDALRRDSSACGGSGECNEADEMLMESEISRRFLEQKKYISPGALKRDQPVCNGGSSGEAYSKTGGCLPEPSNPYNRGCSKYYRCRSDS
ncbi:hypothetical protein REPUB_Repub20aG0052300 [Reevesia pubescens]